MRPDFPSEDFGDALVLLVVHEILETCLSRCLSGACGRMAPGPPPRVYEPGIWEFNKTFSSARDFLVDLGKTGIKGSP